MLSYLRKSRSIAEMIRNRGTGAALPLLVGVLLGGAAVYFSQGASETQHVQAVMQQLDIAKREAASGATQLLTAEVARQDLQRKLTQWEGELQKLKETYAKDKADSERAAESMRTENISLKAKMAKMQKLSDDRKRTGTPQDRK